MYTGDPPPLVLPGDLPAQDELTNMARRLLSEQARHDPRVAAMMRERGIAILSEEGVSPSGAKGSR